MPPLTIEQREAILRNTIVKYIKQGYKANYLSKTSVQLVKPKRFGCGWMIASLFSAGLAIIFYLAKKEDTIYLEVDLNGKVKRIKRKT